MMLSPVAVPFLPQERLRLQHRIGGKAKSAVSLLTAGNGLENHIARRAVFTASICAMIWLRTHICVGIVFVLHFIKAFLKPLSFHDRIARRVEPDQRITAAVKPLQKGCGNALPHYRSYGSAADAWQSVPRRPMVVLQVAGIRTLLAANQIQVAHELCNCGNHLCGQPFGNPLYIGFCCAVAQSHSRSSATVQPLMESYTTWFSPSWFRRVTSSPPHAGNRRVSGRSTACWRGLPFAAMRSNIEPAATPARISPDFCSLPWQELLYSVKCKHFACKQSLISQSNSPFS